jgi:hypothetical protein
MWVSRSINPGGGREKWGKRTANSRYVFGAYVRLFGAHGPAGEILSAFSPRPPLCPHFGRVGGLAEEMLMGTIACVSVG